MNYSQDLFSLEDLKREFRSKSIFGFLEGIWYLDIIYQGKRPEPYSEVTISVDINYLVQKVSSIIQYTNICHNFCFQVESECDGTRSEFQFNSDDFGQNNSQLALPPDESLETENYRREFFAMLEDVVSLGGDLYNLEWLGNV